jgi:hypothetical protein
MPDGDVLKEFLVGVGFQVNDTQLRAAQGRIAALEQQLKRVSAETHRGTTLWSRFFQEFQRGEGPQRQNIETTTRLGKAYEVLGVNLKTLATFAAGGALAASFKNLTDSLAGMHRQAKLVGDTVTNLAGLQFGIGQVTGMSGQAVTAVLTQWMTNLSTKVGVAQVFRGFGVNVEVDERGIVKNPIQAFRSLLAKIAEMTQQGVGSAAIARKFAELGVTLPPELEMLFRDPKMLKEVNDWTAKWGAGLTVLGINLEDLAKRAADFDKQWGLMEAHINQLREAFLDPIYDVFTPILTRINDYFESGEWKKLSWSDVGKAAGDAVVDGITAALTGTERLANAFEAFDEKLKKSAEAFVQEIVNRLSTLDWSNILFHKQFLPDMSKLLPGGGLPGVISGFMAPIAEWWRGRGHVSSGGRSRGDPGHYQEGGVVPGFLHPGEIVLPEESGTIIRQLWDGFRQWWMKSGGYRPYVTIENVEELSEGIVQEMIDRFTPSGGGGGLVPGGALAGAIAGGGPVSAATAAQFREYANYLSSKYGLDQAHINAVLANVMGESGGDPWNVSPEAWGGPSIGLFQEHAEGARALRNYLAGRGTTMGDWKAQIDFAMADARRLIPQWFGPGTAEYLTRFWEGGAGWGYERPAHPTGRLDRLRQIERVLGGDSAALGANYHHVGDRTVTLNSQNNFQIHAVDGYAVGGAIGAVLDRTNADLVRNLSPAVI